MTSHYKKTTACQSRAINKVGWCECPLPSQFWSQVQSFSEMHVTCLSASPEKHEESSYYLLPIWLASKGNCINDFLQYQMPLPNVCTAYCFLFLLRVLKTGLANCPFLVMWQITTLIQCSFILISEIFQNHWLIQFIGFTRRLSNKIELISKAGKPRKQIVTSISPSHTHLHINENMGDRKA